MKVALTKCKDYERENVEKAINTSFEFLGGLSKFVKKGQKVLLKPNLLHKALPESAATTHPMVVEVIARECIKLGAIVTIADSPGGPFTKGYVGGVYKGTGMIEAAKNAGCNLNEDFTSVDVKFDEALVARKMHIINVANEADIIINIAKMKTHCFTGYTGCVKNLFGLIPGLEKIQMHGNNVNLEKFCDFVIDIERFVKDKCVLHVMDAVMAMEGEGPSAGTPKFVGKILASESAYAVDVAANIIMTIKPFTMPMLKRASDRGIIEGNVDCVQILGEDLNKSVVKGFRTVKPNFKKPLAKIIPKFLQKPFFKMLTSRPKIKKKCKGCQKCFEHCPPRAIIMVKDKAVIDYDKCIRCFCCQELCPYLMVKVKKPLLYRVLRFS